MALPQNEIATVTQSTQFLSPRDRRFVPFRCWERGGLGIQDPSAGLDVYDWQIRTDKTTGAVYYGVPTSNGATTFIVPETLVYTISPLPREVVGSFDTNMRPIIAWRDVAANSYFRWFDPVSNQIEVVQLPARCHSLRLALDDVRRPLSNSGFTDTILAYVRFNRVYWRQLRDRFEDEYLVGAGFPTLYQIGMNEKLRFQFARSPVVPDEEPEITYKQPSNRAGKLAGFDDFGAGAYYDWPKPGVEGDAGISNSVDKFTVTANGQTFFVRGADGVWDNSSVQVRVDFYLDDVDLRASRTFTFSVSREGYITRAQSAADGEAAVTIFETGVGTRTYTMTAALDMGRGITFHLIAAQGTPTTGDFLPRWNDDGDFYGGGFVPTGRVHYVDYGTHVAFNMSDATGYTSRSVSTRMRWGVGSVPEALRPATARTVPCTVSNNGVAVRGLALFNTDGSAEFWPLAVSSTRLVRGTFAVTTEQARDKGLPTDWQLVFAKAGPSDFARIPTLTDITPDDVARFDLGELITATGTNFTATSVIRVDGVALATTFNSSTELQATLPASVLDEAGVLDIDVFTPTPGGGFSGVLPFTVLNPLPVLTLLTPDIVVVNEPDQDITITGTGFVPESVAEMDGVPLTTVYVSATELTATIPTSGIFAADVRDITVVNPAPGGGESNALELNLSALTILQFTDGYTPPAGDSIILDFTNP